MYNGAGKFVKNLGIPSKSGVSGGLLSVVPGIGALTTWGPKLNDEGNTVKGIVMVQKIAHVYNNFNLFHKDHNKRDVLAKPYTSEIRVAISPCNCASIGDIEGISRIEIMGIDLNTGDYDNRTPLHIASASGQLDIVKFLLKKGVNPNPKDRWGATPLDDAKSEDIAEVLQNNGAVKGDCQTEYLNPSSTIVNDDFFRLLYAAFYNNVDLIKSLHINLELNGFDYDRRSALGIAASEGNLDTVKYLALHGAEIEHKDARGNNALDDAKREKRQEVVEFLTELLSK